MMSADRPSTSSRSEFGRRVDDLIRAGLAEMDAQDAQAALAASTEDSTPTDIPDDARLWTALTPGWTESLALSCSFPGCDPKLKQTPLPRMRDAGLLNVFATDVATSDAPDVEYYVMNPVDRASVLRPYVYTELQVDQRTQSSAARLKIRSPIVRALRVGGHVSGERVSGASFLLSAVADIGRRISGSTAPVPAEVLRWSDLARSATEPAIAAGTLESQVRSRVAKADVAGIRDWIDAARPLAALMEYAGNPRLSIVIGNAGRAVELFKRRQADFRHLASFHRRDEQIAAVQQLLNGPDGHWALHFIGPGGVGKTMLIRYITCLLARSDQSPCAADDNPFTEDVVVARIDFDYLNLDYPRLNPGLLLDAFAQELRATGDSRANSLFDEASGLFDKVHQELQAAGYRLDGRSSRHPLIVEGVRKYCDALRLLRKRVLLILDTCEELAKADSVREPSSALEETFRILRALHDGPETLLNEEESSRGGVPNLRVILSGRRLLAQSGAGWQVLDSTLPSRAYMGVHQVRGFTHTEAERYLRHERVPDELIQPVLRSSSPDPGSGFKFDPPLDEGPDDLRCNPYLLRLYMDWALEDPAPKPEILASGGADNYVELRIIQRLNDATVKNLLPLVALLGHVDLPTLRTASGLDEDEAQQVFGALQDNEWMGMHRSGVDDKQREILDLVPNVRDALVAYFDAQDEPSLSLRARAADTLEAFTLHSDLGVLEWSDFDAALRAMDYDPARGAGWWPRAAERLLRERNFDWDLIQPLLDRLTAADGAARLRDVDAPLHTPRENRLRPLVLATQAEAWLHARNFERLQPTWREIVDKTRDSPHGPAFAQLHRRALGGQVAAARYTSTPPSLELASAFWQAWSTADEPFARPEDAASVIAAMETLVDVAEVRAESDRAAALALLTLPSTAAMPETNGPEWAAQAISAARAAWIERMPAQAHASAYAELQAFSSSLAGRALRLAGSPEQALKHLRDSLSVAVTGAPPAYWPDWRPPPDSTTRLKLEFARGAYPALLGVDEVLEVLGASQPSAATTNVDADRVQSTILQLRLAQGSLGLAELGPLGWLESSGLPGLKRDGFVQPAEPINAHRYVSPLFVSICQVLAARGLPEVALNELRNVSNNRTSYDPETVWHAERALLHLIRRLRLNDAPQPTVTTLSSSLRVDDVLLAWTMQGMDGPRRRTAATPTFPSTAGGDWRYVHGTWQTSFVLDQPTALTAFAKFNQTLGDNPLSPDTPDFGQASVGLDVVEMRLIAAAYVLDAPYEGQRWIAEDATEWATHHPAQPSDSLRILLRTQALLQDGPIDIPTELIARLGPRRAAEIALDEAELLALRLPRQAVSLLWWSAAHFVAGADPYAASFASTLAVLLRASPASPSDAAAYSEARAPEVGDAVRAYEQLRASLAGLPSAKLPPASDELATLAAAPTEAGLSALSPVLLRPWLLRLVACQVWQQHPTSDGMAPVRTWLETNCGVLDGDRVGLPTEWTRFLADRTGPSSTPPPVARAIPAPAPPVAAATSNRTSSVAYLVLGAAAIAGVLAAAFYLWQRALDLFIPSANSTEMTWQIVWFVVTLLGLGSLIYISGNVWIRLRRELALTRQLDIDILPAEVKPFFAERHVRFRAMLVRPRLAWKWPPFTTQVEEVEPGDSTAIVDLDAYASQAQAVPSGLVAGLRRLVGRGLDLPLSVRLRPVGDLHGVSWEGMLTLAVSTTTEVPLNCWRSVESPRARPPLPPLPASPRGVSVAATESANVVVRGGLGESRQNGVSWTFARNVSYEAPEPDSLYKGPEVLHIIGTVVAESSGPVLELLPKRTYGTQISTKSGESTVVEPRTLRATDVVQLYPWLRVCVLQGQPEDEADSRLDSDRQAAWLTRLFAAEIARDGVVVIVIPPLAHSVAPWAWGRVIDALPACLSHGIGRVLPTLGEVRRKIVESSVDSATGRECALDVCVYDAPAAYSGSSQTSA
jgi:hypothetical protein